MKTDRPSMKQLQRNRNFSIFKMAANRRVGSVCHISGPTTHICGYYRYAEFDLNPCNSFLDMNV